MSQFTIDVKTAKEKEKEKQEKQLPDWFTSRMSSMIQIHILPKELNREIDQFGISERRTEFFKYRAKFKTWTFDSCGKYCAATTAWFCIAVWAWFIFALVMWVSYRQTTIMDTYPLYNNQHLLFELTNPGGSIHQTDFYTHLYGSSLYDSRDNNYDNNNQSMRIYQFPVKPTLLAEKSAVQLEEFPITLTSDGPFEKEFRLVKGTTLNIQTICHHNNNNNNNNNNSQRQNNAQFYVCIDTYYYTSNTEIRRKHDVECTNYQTVYNSTVTIEDNKSPIDVSITTIQWIAPYLTHELQCNVKLGYSHAQYNIAEGLAVGYDAVKNANGAWIVLVGHDDLQLAYGYTTRTKSVWASARAWWLDIFFGVTMSVFALLLIVFLICFCPHARQFYNTHYTAEHKLYMSDTEASFLYFVCNGTPR